MAVRKLIRRRARRAAPMVRRIASRGVMAARAAARERMQGGGGLMIGGVHDPAEKAADRVADQVMRMPEPAALVRRARAGCAPEDPRKARRQVADEDEDAVRMRAATERIAPAATAAPAPAAAKAAIGAMGAGRPLSRADRTFFEPRFGADFSRVRVHDDGAAAHAARALDARAFTLGHDIAFAPGERTPGTPGGDRLMAHELTHVVQQSSVDANGIGRDHIQRDERGGQSIEKRSLSAIPISPLISSRSSSSRPLTPFEAAEAHRVFGSALRTEGVRISEGGLMTVGGYARALPDRIFFPDGSFRRTDFISYLIHELTHVWQYQQGAEIPGMIYEAIVANYDYGGRPASVRRGTRDRRSTNSRPNSRATSCPTITRACSPGATCRPTRAWSIRFVLDVQRSTDIAQ